jgi:hypothetical protein
LKRDSINVVAFRQSQINWTKVTAASALLTRKYGATSFLIKAIRFVVRRAGENFASSNYAICSLKTERMNEEWSTILTQEVNGWRRMTEN